MRSGIRGKTGGGWKSGLARVTLAAAMAVGATCGGMARADVGAGGGALLAGPVIPTGCWRFVVKADAAAINQGRSDFEEFVVFEGSTGAYTAQEMSRLGFSPSSTTSSLNSAGQITFTAVLTSNSHGTATWSGTFGTNTVSGTLAWAKDGKTYNYSFTGAPYTPVDVDN